MITLSGNIASWEEDYLSSEQKLAGQDSIATEAQQPESPAWENCLDAFLKIYVDSSTSNDDCDARPNREAIGAAIAWIAFLRKIFPSAPPTCITPEPDGGVIVERRVQLHGEHDCLCQLTFYNDGSAERTDYLNGRILQMTPIPKRPQAWNA